MKKVIIHTDGGCSGNPGPGGWAATLTYGAHTKEISGGELATTNNRMEIRAAMEALNALKEPCEVVVFTDSEYVKDGITQWVPAWKAKGWKRGKKPVKNLDLWQALDAAVARHRVEWKWVRGHTGHEGNERCDGLATAAIEKIQRECSAAVLREALERFIESTKPAAPQAAAAPPGLFGE